VAIFVLRRVASVISASPATRAAVRLAALAILVVHRIAESIAAAYPAILRAHPAGLGDATDEVAANLFFTRAVFRAIPAVLCCRAYAVAACLGARPAIGRAGLAVLSGATIARAVPTVPLTVTAVLRTGQAIFVAETDVVTAGVRTITAVGWTCCAILEGAANSIPTHVIARAAVRGTRRAGLKVPAHTVPTGTAETAIP
jgi:hypothetical protein